MTSPKPTLIRAVSRWQIVGLSVNDVIGSGIYLLPAAAAALLGAASLWAILLAGLAVAMIILCYAQASSYFDQPGGHYLYAREAFGSFVGFEIGWMAWVTRVTSAAALSNGLVLAVIPLWPAAGGTAGRVAVIFAVTVLLTWINVLGVKNGARTAVILVICKMVPLLLFIAIGAFYVDSGRLTAYETIAPDSMGKAALLLLFAYAGFENTPAGAGEYQNPRRDIPFALMSMIVIVTITYSAITLVAIGTLPGLAASKAPLAEAAALFSGNGLKLALTMGAVVSIIGTLGNTALFGPRYLHAMAADGFGPAFLANVHPRWRTPAAAIVTQGVIAFVLAVSSSFVALALLSVIARLATYLSTTAAVIVLQRRFADRTDVLKLPGGPLIPVLAILLSLGLLASATWQNLAAGAIALGVGAVLYRFRRPTPA